jgi:hypothetical protein
MTIPYSDKDIQNFNNLLTIIMSNAETKEENIYKLIPNEQENKLVHIINEHYPSFKIENSFYLLTKEGVEIQRIGIKQHIIKLYTEEQINIKIKELTLKELTNSEERFIKTNRNSIIAIIISIILPLVLFGIERTFDYYQNNRPDNANYNCNARIEITQPKIINDSIFKVLSGNVKNENIYFTHIDSLKIKLNIKTTD